MMIRRSVVGLSVVMSAVVGCAAEPSDSKGSESAENRELGVTFHALTVVECNNLAVRCLIANPLRPATCSLQLADCLATTAVQEAVDLAECTLENVGCSTNAVAELECEDLVDCQQEVARCVSDTIGDVTGIDVAPVLDELDPVVDEAGETCGEVVDVVGEAGDVVVDAAGDVVGNAIDAVECARQARVCVRRDPARWLPCQAQFARCSAQVADNAGQDAVDTVQAAGDIAQGVASDAAGNVAGTVDCAADYRQCRARGGEYYECSRAARACELEVL
jgi:hypothetical protein